MNRENKECSKWESILDRKCKPRTECKDEMGDTGREVVPRHRSSMIKDGMEMSLREEM